MPETVKTHSEKKKPLKMTDFDKLHVNNFMLKPRIHPNFQYNCIYFFITIIKFPEKKYTRKYLPTFLTYIEILPYVG